MTRRLPVPREQQPGKGVSFRAASRRASSRAGLAVTETMKKSRSSQGLSYALAGGLLALLAASCSPGGAEDKDREGNQGTGGSGDGDGDGACVLSDAENEADYLNAFGSGSRLRARVLKADGMPDVFLGFFDSELGVNCDFLTASDGALRCLPRETLIEAQIGFADDACTLPLVQTSADCSSGGYLRQGDVCGETYTIRGLEPLISEVTAHQDFDACMSEGTTVSPGAEIFVATPPLDPSEFVMGTETLLPGSCRAQVRVIEAEDGARGPLGIKDAGHDISCVRFSSPGVDSCQPEQTAFTAPALHLSDLCDDEPVSYGIWNRDPSCSLPPVIKAESGEFDYYQVEGVYEGPAYLSPGCTPARDEEWVSVILKAGEGIRGSDLAELSRVPVGTGRLRPLVTTEGTAVLMADASLSTEPLFYDSELDTQCVLYPFDDGNYRCVPTSSGFVNGADQEFNDALCQDRIVLCAMGEDCTDTTFLGRQSPLASCSSAVTGDSVWVAASKGTDTFYNSGGDCQPFGVSGSEPWLATEFDLSLLATAVEQTLEP